MKAMHGLCCSAVLVGMLSIVAGSTVAATLGRPPNVVMFLVDDLGATDLGCFGSTFYETPHIDGLAKGGMRFTAAYSACPVCSPTRASIMTGRYPQRTGITDYIGRRNQPEVWQRNTRLLPAPYSDRLALEERTIAEQLLDAGYATFFAGKWHLGGKGYLPSEQGFNINKGGTNAGYPHSYISPYGNPRLADGPPGEHLPLRLAKETCQFIETNVDRPFLAYLSLFSVHVPLQAPAELVEKYEAKAAKLTPTEPAWGREQENKVRLVQNHPTYAGMIEAMDDAVGMVLAKLDELGLSEDTVVIFTSDNGGLATAEGSPTSNLPLRAGKGWLYEGGIRVPTIVRWPGVVAPSSTCETPIVSMDYYPTLLEAVGQTPVSEDHLDGVSFVPLLRGGSLDSRALYWDYPHYSNQGGPPASAVHDGRWKLIRWHEDGAVELYDLEADPSETNNLVEQHAGVAKRLEKSLAEWRREVGAKSPTANPNYR